MAKATPAQTIKIDDKLVRQLANTVRGLSMDAIDKADSGHPGLPLGCADFAVTLWYYFLRYNPSDPKWPGRDKFILSGGHGSMLLYSLIHLAGYDLPIDELKSFRQWGSRTPGHPENFLTEGVETTTGPLGQGFGASVGFALADAMMAARTHRDDFTPFASNTYVLCSDGDLMEGVAMEAASFAGHMKLGNLIALYDDNDISLDGPTSLTFAGEDTASKFEAIGWHVQKVDGHNPSQVGAAIAKAKAETGRPSLIICKTIIGFGSPKAGTSGVHGSPLGAENTAKTKEKLGIPAKAFHIPDSDKKAWAARRKELKKDYDAWQSMTTKARKKHPEALSIMEAFLAQELPADLESKLPSFEAGKSVATRKASQATLKEIGKAVPFLVGGSADLSVSTNAFVDDSKVAPDNLAGRHLFFGVREHGMGAIVNGMVNHGAFRAFGATFLTFSDYMRGSVRLSALMHARSIWVYTHDSIFLGEDGPTHQPVEHVMALRSIPNLTVIRPGDAIETAEAWVAALRVETGPVALILTRQNLPTFDRSSKEFKAQGDLSKGGYVFRPEQNPKKLDGILIGTGSELHLCVEAARHLEAKGRSIRVVSLPSWELFEQQTKAYREKVLPPSVKLRVSVEAGITLGWQRYIGDAGIAIGQDGFGASAPAEVLAQKFGFTAKKIAAAVEKAALAK